jgi:hypothetical protein
MKIKIRDELNVDEPINLRRLTPRIKLYAGFMVKIHESRWYQTGRHKKEEQDYAKQVQQDERLKNALLAVLYRELVDNKTLSDKKDTCKEITVSIDSKYQKSLDRILKQKDFIMYDIKRVEEQPDIRKAFPDMAIILQVSKKVV